MLDKNDITKVCGTITMAELISGMGAKQSSTVYALINEGRPYQDKYIIIESDAGETSYRSEKYKVFMTRGEDRFIVTESGKVFIEGHRNKQLKPFWSKGRLVVRCDKTMFTVARLVAEHINGWNIEGKCIGFKDGNPGNVGAKNLMIIGVNEK